MMDNKTRRVATLAITAVVAAAFAASSIATPIGRKGQGQGLSYGYGRRVPTDQRYGDGKGKFAQQLNLTDRQRDAIRRITADHREKVQALMRSNASPEQKRIRRLELRTQMRNRILEVLTPEQRQKARQMWAQKSERRAYRHGAIQRDFAELNLTNAQKERIRDIRQGAMDDIREVRRNPNLSDRAKQDRIKVIRQRAHEAILLVLTPEQRRELNEMHDQHRGDNHGPGRYDRH